MKHLVIAPLIVLCLTANSQVVLNADGPGDTYELISSVLAPGYNPIEVPDCNHEAFGEHIDEVFDDELNAHVFRFHLHTTPDNDRCIKFDRQRNEIKSYDKSPNNLKGVENEEVVYKWKFKLAEGFQSSPNFTHIHQLKSVGGSLASMPMYTLTTRKSSPDRLELRYAETSSQVTLKKTPLAPFIGTWVSVTETITYGETGSYEIDIKRESDGEILFSYSNSSIMNWRPGADFVRPKWGIYRSLNNAQDLRDEQVLFADFSVQEYEVSGSMDVSLEEPIVLRNPATNTIELRNLTPSSRTLMLYSLNGIQVLSQNIANMSSLKIDVSHLPKGTYVLQLRSEEKNRSEMIVLY